MAVRIDEDFARFGSKSYAINKINSVDVRVRKPHGVGLAILFALGAFLFVVSGADQLGKPDSVAPTSFVLGAVLGGLSAWLFKRSTIREYHLFLMTSSSEAQAFVSRDEGEVATLRDEIETAMAHHSRAALRGA